MSYFTQPLGDAGGYGATSTQALALAKASGQAIAAVVRTADGSFAVMPLSSTSDYDQIQSDADSGTYSYTALYDQANSPDALLDEYSTGVVTSTSILKQLENPWVLAAAGLLVAAAIWHQSQKPKRARARKTRKIKLPPIHKRRTIKMQAVRA